MILVTGATGLVGGHLLWYLLQTNQEIIAIRRRSSNLDALKDIFRFYGSELDDYYSRIIWCYADVLNRLQMQEAMKGVSIVYHCAAIVSLDEKQSNLFDTNVEGTKVISELALEHKIDKLCFVSSIATCGNSVKDGVIDENSAWIDSELRTSYSRSKYFSEQVVWRSIEHGLRAFIVNPGVILGVSNINSGSSTIFRQVRKGLPCYTDGGTGYIDVRDVVEIMVKLMSENCLGERYILVGENCSNKEILNSIADGFNKKHPFIRIPKSLMMIVAVGLKFIFNVLKINPLIDKKMVHSITKRSYYSNTKIKQLLNFEFRSIDTCISQICAFMQKNSFD